MLCYLDIRLQKVLNDKFNIGGGCEVQNIEVTRKILDMLNKPHSLIGVSNDRPGVDKRYRTDFSKLTRGQDGFLRYLLMLD